MITRVSEKIDFLMKLTDTQNAVLARALSFDASYISRIRTGKRGLPPKTPFIEPAAAFFANHICEDYQKHTLSYELGRPYPESRADAAAAIVLWLSSEKGAQGKAALSENVFASEHASPSTDSKTAGKPGVSAQVQLFYGNEGKRDAVESFLNALCETNEPHTLLLHSDENMSWLIEDPAFTQRWRALLSRFIDNGGRIRIVHSVSRNANELWEAAQKWVPLYMTGAIEPYYYPLLRDGVYRRTLFVAPGQSALISSSVPGMQRESLSILIDDANAVAALESEIGGYIALCRPLVHKIVADTPAQLAAQFSPFIAPDSNVLAEVKNGSLVCACESGHALMASTEKPYMLLEVLEARIIGAVWELLRNLPRDDRLEGDEARELLSQMLEDPTRTNAS